MTIAPLTVFHCPPDVVVWIYTGFPENWRSRSVTECFIVLEILSPRIELPFVLM